MSTIEDLLKLPQEVLKFHSGPKWGPLPHVSTPEQCQSGGLVFVSREEQVFDVIERGAKCIVAVLKLQKLLDSDKISNDVKNQITFFLCPSIPHALSFVLESFDKKQLLSKDCQIHPSAIIHPSARIGSGTRVGANTVLEEGCVVGSNSILGPNLYIGPFAKVGDNTKIHPFVSLGSFCEVGHRCEIMSNTTIGSDGFGFATMPNKEHRKIPQIGRVIIEDDVEIGANCTIDRATIEVTRIRRGLKMDNLCHIAHNVEMGEWNLITAGFITAGSTKTGSHVYTGGGVHLNDHIEIANDVTLVGRTAVTNDIKNSGVYGGFPAVPYKESIKSLSLFHTLPKMRKQILKLYKTLNLKPDDE